MANLEIKLDLAKLPTAKYATINGAKYVVIPAEKNPLIYVGAKGIYLTLTAVERKEVKDGQTHFVKPNYPTEYFKAMDEQERNAIPIVGSVKSAGKPQQGGSEVLKTAVVINNDVELGDMPF